MSALTWEFDGHHTWTLGDPNNDGQWMAIVVGVHEEDGESGFDLILPNVPVEVFLWLHSAQKRALKHYKEKEQ